MLAHGWWFSPGTPASSTTKTGRQDIAEIWLKVALNTINQSINEYITLFSRIMVRILIKRLYSWHYSSYYENSSHFLNRLWNIWINTNICYINEDRMGCRGYWVIYKETVPVNQVSSRRRIYVIISKSRFLLYIPFIKGTGSVV